MIHRALKNWWSILFDKDKKEYSCFNIPIQKEVPPMPQKNSSNCKCYTCRLQGSKECVMCPINFKKIIG